jgi:hypothetical protein
VFENNANNIYADVRQIARQHLVFQQPKQLSDFRRSIFTILSEAFVGTKNAGRFRNADTCRQKIMSDTITDLFSRLE